MILQVSRQLAVGILMVALCCRTGIAQEHQRELRALQPEIDRAIDDGVQWLLEQQLPDGSWSFMQDQYPTGQTALAVYTLLKSGLSRNHAAVKRGLAYLVLEKPTRTYSLSLHIMALEATHDPTYKPLIKELLGRLLSWQAEEGAFGYPGFPSEERQDSRSKRRWMDLSNTQFAALGLRSAMLAGLKIPKSVLKRLLACALEFQESERRVVLPPDPESGKPDGYARTPGSSTGYAAGFSYSRGSERATREPTGSMTTAGLGVLLIVRDCFGKSIPLGVQKRIRRSAELALNWMRLNWSVESNPGSDRGFRRRAGGGGWHYYYLYGLERVGALLMEEVVAGHAWYLEGARVLVREQGRDGAWGRGSRAQPDTCFALLFLKRATWVGRVTGKRARVAASFESLEGDILIKGQGSPVLTLWLSGFSRSILECWRRGMRKPVMRIVRVEYLIDEKPIGSVPGDPTSPWKGESLAFKHAFTEPGTHVVSARAYLLPPGVKRRDADTRLVVLRSGSFHVTVEKPADTATDEMSRAVLQNLLRDRAIKVGVSSARAPGEKGEQACDGREGTAWVADPTDAEPAITLRLAKAVRARYLLLSQSFDRAATEPRRRPGRFRRGRRSPVARATKVSVTVNGSKEPLVVDFDEGDRSRRIDLLREFAVGKLCIRILETSSATRASCGFSEIYLYR